MKSREITRVNCEEKMELRRNIVKDKFTEIVKEEVGDTPTRFYFSPAKSGNPRNAFLFDRDHILRIFFTEEMVTRLAGEIDAKAPTHLLAILGAHNQDIETDNFKKGQSTVIVMGVKSKDGGTLEDLPKDAVNVPIRSMNSGDSNPLADEDVIVGFEYPPSDGLLVQPPSKSLSSPMEFTFNI